MCRPENQEQVVRKLRRIRSMDYIVWERVELMYTLSHIHIYTHMLYSNERKRQCVYLMSTLLSEQKCKFYLFEWIVSGFVGSDNREPLCCPQGLVVSTPSPLICTHWGKWVQHLSSGVKWKVILGVTKLAIEFNSMSLPHSDKVDWQHV